MTGGQVLADCLLTLIVVNLFALDAKPYFGVTNTTQAEAIFCRRSAILRQSSK